MSLLLLLLLLLFPGSEDSSSSSSDLVKRSVSSAAALADLVGIPGIESHWKLIGLGLGVSEDTLDAIDKKHSKNSNRCKQLMFKEAVKRGVTWKEVLDKLSTLPLLSAVKKICANMNMDYTYSESTVPVRIALGCGFSEWSVSHRLKWTTIVHLYVHI